MPGRAPHGEHDAENAFVGGVRLDARGAIGAVPDGPADLGEGELGPDQLAVVLQEGDHTVPSTALLVGHRGEDQRALRAKPAPGEVSHGERHGDGLVEHVDRATPPHLTADQLTTEGVVLPAVAVGGDHIGVGDQRQRRRRSVRSLDAGHHRRPAAGRLDQLDLEAGP